jgi:phosphoglycerate dehydrogenase-like enzyme
MGVELTGKTLGLIGAGNIGSIVADRAKGLKMKVIAYDPYLSPNARRIWASRKSSSTICSPAPISSRCTRR